MGDNETQVECIKDGAGDRTGRKVYNQPFLVAQLNLLFIKKLLQNKSQDAFAKPSS